MIMRRARLIVIVKYVLWIECKMYLVSLGLQVGLPCCEQLRMRSRLCKGKSM